MCILAARLALHKGSAAGSWSGVAKSMCSVILKRDRERKEYNYTKKTKTFYLLCFHCGYVFHARSSIRLMFRYCNVRYLIKNILFVVL